MITPIELAESQYNARDVLGMCRVFPILVAEVERANVVDVYNTDEQLADLALQMTRIGMPVNSELRAEIGARLYALRDAAIEVLKPYTEGERHVDFIAWVATFFAAKARKGEPVDGAIRVGPTRAQAAVDELVDTQRQWREYKKGNASDTTAVATADAMLAEAAELLKLAKIDLKVALFEADTNDGLLHSAESAFEMRKAIRAFDAEKAYAKAGVKYTAKVQQAAILRAAGVPLTEVTDKAKLPRIDKDILERFSRHPSAKALLKFVLVSSTINVYIEGEKRAGKTGGKSKPVMVTETGYLNPQWAIHKITGRWGSSPNVQNWSKRAGGGEENLRAMIEAPAGYTFVGADFCLAGGTLLDTPNGKIAIEDIREGDLVYTFRDDRCACSHVARLKFQGVKPTAVVHLDNGATVRCTLDHPWLRKHDCSHFVEVGIQRATSFFTVVAFSRTRSHTVQSLKRFTAHCRKGISYTTKTAIKETTT